MGESYVRRTLPLDFDGLKLGTADALEQTNLLQELLNLFLQPSRIHQCPCSMGSAHTGQLFFPLVYTTVPTWVFLYFFSAHVCTPQCPPGFSCISSVPTHVYTTVPTWCFLYLFSAHMCTPQCPPGFYRTFSVPTTVPTTVPT